jgi:hypothetical protein
MKPLSKPAIERWNTCYDCEAPTMGKRCRRCANLETQRIKELEKLKNLKKVG